MLDDHVAFLTPTVDWEGAIYKPTNPSWVSKLRVCFGVAYCKHGMGVEWGGGLGSFPTEGRWDVKGVCVVTLDG